jgi:alkylation response protein AidB-like acyl-CoA dehydrogenase
MQRWLTDSHGSAYEGFQAFVAHHVAPCAERWDRDEQIPAAVIAAMAGHGYLGCPIPERYGGTGADVLTFGLLHEAFGRGSSALTGVLTVQAMVSMALLKWGTAEQKTTWLPALASGQSIGAFALTEPAGGSALQSLTTEFRPQGDGLVLNGRKKWISCARFADVFLVFGKLGGRAAACLVRRDQPGVHAEPLNDLMGFRAAGLAALHFQDVRLSAGDLVGKPGFALSHVAPVGLHYGRISTACSALGLLRGCFEDSVAHAAERKIGDLPMRDLGTVRALLARMGADLEAAGLLCHSACRAEDEHRPDAFERTLMAKYFTSRAAVAAASDAVQLRGASGCHGSTPVSRYYRDAKIMEIIEGTTQVHEDLLGRLFVDRAGKCGTAIGAD